MNRLILTLAICLYSLRLLAAPDLIVYNAKVTTFDGSTINAFSVKDGRFAELSNDPNAMLKTADSNTLVINAYGKRIIPGLNDSHLHAVRAGRFYNAETRWEGVPTLAQALDIIAKQAKRTPSGQWVRVIGGWSPYQFREKRMPTASELNKVAPDTPVFVLHLYSGGILNQAAMKALAIDEYSMAPAGSRYELGFDGKPTGLLIADPNPAILYKTIGALPPLSQAEQINSSRQFYRKLLSLGETSTVDAGGGGHLFPENYQATIDLAKAGELNVRVAAYLFPQQPKQELNQFKQWMSEYSVHQNIGLGFPVPGLTIDGGGELLAWSASDYENFLSSRPELAPEAEKELEQIVSLHVKNGWPFRLHATYDESISRMLNVLEKVNKTDSLSNIRWAFDHAETVSDKSLKRIKALGGGIAIQGRMAFAGEAFIQRYGADAASHSPPIKKILQMGIPVGLGTDGTRVSSFNPWSTYYWVVSGKTVGKTQLYDASNTLDRLTALKLFTSGSAWFSGEEQVKGQIKAGQLADFAILNQDILLVEDDELLQTKAELTVVNGKVEYATSLYPELKKQAISAIPVWSPVNYVEN